MSKASIRLTPEQRRERLQQDAEARTRKEYAAAGLSYDGRTAAGRREITIHNLGHTKRAEANGYATLIRNKDERSQARLAALKMFDDLCHRAYGGLMPEPNFTPSVDTSSLQPGMPDRRVDGLREMQRLVGRIGEEAHAILVHRVFYRMQFTAMTEEGQGDERSLNVLFLNAIDCVARFYGMLPPSRRVQVMHLRLDNGGLPNRTV